MQHVARVSPGTAFSVHSPVREVMNIPISIAMASNPRTWPIFDGKSRRTDHLIPSAVHPRSSSGGSCALPISTFRKCLFPRCSWQGQGDERWSACLFSLPGNSSMPNPGAARFGHRATGRPEGKRVGVPSTSRPPPCGRAACSSTSSVLLRGHGFWMERTPSHSTAPPPGLRLRQADHQPIPRRRALAA